MLIPPSSRHRARVALLACLFAAACSKEVPPPPAPKAALEGSQIVFPAGSVQLSSISTHAVADAKPGTARLNGRVVWDEDRTVRIVAPFGGRVTGIAAKAGDVVRAGATLATIAAPEFGQAQADARKAATDFALAEKNIARVKDLVSGGVAPRKDLAAAEADYARAEAELARARARLRLYGGADAVDQSFALRTPIAGTVVERNINPGQELRPDSSAAALFVVTDPTRVWVMLDATERDLGLVQVGRMVTLAAAPYPGETFPATIDLVSDFIDPATRTVKARARLDNAGRKLKGEMFVSAAIESGPQTGVAVPSRAVFLNDDKFYVWVEQATGRFARVQVKTEGELQSASGKPLIRVVAGLEPGQKVVVDGSLLLQRLYTQLTKS